jgi:ABC-type cobalamin/Fe3+-siderophores transport system ATPase subunit
MVLHDGHIVADGPGRTVLTPDLLARVYGIEAEIGVRGEDIFVVPWRRLGTGGAGAAR